MTSPRIAPEDTDKAVISMVGIRGFQAGISSSVGQDMADIRTQPYPLFSRLIAYFTTKRQLADMVKVSKLESCWLVIVGWPFSCYTDVCFSQEDARITKIYYDTQIEKLAKEMTNIDRDRLPRAYSVDHYEFFKTSLKEIKNE